MNAWDVLADALEADGAMDDVNVYRTATADFVPPAVVIRPGTPWLESAGSPYPTDLERYVAVAVVSASSPADSMARLHRMVHTVADIARAEGFGFEEASEPVLDETNTPALTSALTLTYSNCEPEES